MKLDYHLTSSSAGYSQDTPLWIKGPAIAMGGIVFVTAIGAPRDLDYALPPDQPHTHAEPLRGNTPMREVHAVSTSSSSTGIHITPIFPFTPPG